MDWCYVFGEGIVGGDQSSQVKSWATCQMGEDILDPVNESKVEHENCSWLRTTILMSRQIPAPQVPVTDNASAKPG